MTGRERNRGWGLRQRFGATESSGLPYGRFGAPTAPGRRWKARSGCVVYCQVQEASPGRGRAPRVGFFAPAKVAVRFRPEGPVRVEGERSGWSGASAGRSHQEEAGWWRALHEWARGGRLVTAGRRVRSCRVTAPGNEKGAATPLTLMLGLTLVVFPVMILVLTLPAWEQRAVDAEDAARAAARVLAAAPNWASGRAAAGEAIGELAYNDGLSLSDITVTYSGDLAPGGSVTASVTVVVPAGEVPGLGSVGHLHYTASSTEHVDTYEGSTS